MEKVASLGSNERLVYRLGAVQDYVRLLYHGFDDDEGKKFLQRGEGGRGGISFIFSSVEGWVLYCSVSFHNMARKLSSAAAVPISQRGWCRLGGKGCQ